MDPDIGNFEVPKPLGPYSPAVRVAGMVYLSGQIPINTDGELEGATFEEQVQKVFYNLQQATAMSGAQIDEIVKMTVYLTDMSNMNTLNQVMADLLEDPYPARVVVGVASLPKNAQICVEATLYVSQ